MSPGAIYLACFNISEYCLSTVERNSFLLGRLQLWLQYICSRVNKRTSFQKLAYMYDHHQVQFSTKYVRYLATDARLPVWMVATPFKDPVYGPFQSDGTALTLFISQCIDRVKSFTAALRLNECVPHLLRSRVRTVLARDLNLWRCVCGSLVTDGLT